METINFFAPIYFVEDGELESYECAALEPKSLTIPQRLINLAEYFFAYDKAYAVKSTQSLSNPWIVSRFKKADESISSGLLRIIITIGLVTTCYFFHSVLILPAVLGCIKLYNYLSHPPHEEKSASESDSVIGTSSDESDRSDEEIAELNFINELKLLRKNGVKYREFSTEIHKINKSNNRKKAEALYQTFSFFQSYCRDILKTPRCADFKVIIRNAIISLTELKSAISIRIKGIPNIGMSCYMNAALQALMGIPGLVDRIMALDFNKVPAEKKMILEALRAFLEAYNNPKIEPENLTSCAETLREAFYDAGDLDHSSTKNEIEKIIGEVKATNQGLDCLEELLLNLKSVKTEEIGQQNDAIRIIHSILELLGDGIPTVELKIPIENDLESKRNVTNTPQSPRPTYLLLPMERMIAQNKLSLRELIADYFRVHEEGSEENQLLTKNLMGEPEYSSAWKEQILIAGSPPENITFQLTRLASVRKNDEWVEEHTAVAVELEPNEVFDLTDYFEEKMIEPVLYRVSSVVRHDAYVVKDKMGGHYTSIKRDPQRPNHWNYCNDSKTEQIHETALREELSHGYIYFLERFKPIKEVEDVLIEEATSLEEPHEIEVKEINENVTADSIKSEKII